jgi:hypothetical protein
MGAKTWMLVLADTNARGALAAKPQLDREATQRLANTLFPGISIYTTFRKFWHDAA